MEIDPRGPRFGAAMTTVVLAVVMITQSGWLLAAQFLVFAIGAVAGLRYAPYGMPYRLLIRPRLGPVHSAPIQSTSIQSADTAVRAAGGRS